MTLDLDEAQQIIGPYLRSKLIDTQIIEKIYLCQTMERKKEFLHTL